MVGISSTIVINTLPIPKYSTEDTPDYITTLINGLEERISNSINNISSVVDGITNTNLINIVSQISSLSGEILDKLDILYSDIRTISGDIQTISGDIQTISGDIQMISGDIQTISGGIYINIPTDYERNKFKWLISNEQVDISKIII